MRIFFHKKIILLIIIMLIPLSLTGCWNRRELSEIGIVGAVAIDANEDKVKLTYEIITPRSMNSKGGEVEAASYFQSDGKSIFEANRNATLQFAKKLFWSDVNILFFNQKAGDNGLLNYLEFFNRDHEARGYVNIAISKGSTAYELIGMGGAKSDVPSAYIEKLIDNYKANGKGVSIKVLDFLKAYYEEGIEPITGVIQRIKKTNSEFETYQNEKEQFVPSNEGIAAFREDKLVGFLDGIQTRSYNIVTNNIKSGVIVSASPDNEGMNSVEIIKASSKIEVKMIDGKYNAFVNVEINGTVVEETGKKDIASFEEIQKIQQNTSELIKKEIEDSIKKVQEYKTDIFGFGQSIHRKNPTEWKKIKNIWNEIFSTIEVEIKVKTKIHEVGLSNEQLSAKEGK